MLVSTSTAGKNEKPPQWSKNRSAGKLSPASRFCENFRFAVSPEIGQMTNCKRF
jgi:hypothetical protein